MNTCLKIAGATAVLAASIPAFAKVELNEYLSLEGYAAVTGAIVDPKGTPSSDTLFDSGRNNLDAARVSLLGAYGDFSGKVSAFYVPGSSAGGGFGDAKVLDAYVSYTNGAFTVTAGKYLSYLGYEAFEAVNMNQLTWGFSSGIPAYHTGVKVDYATDAFSVGFSVTDSLGSSGIGHKGDNNFSDGLGYELVFVYTGIEKLTLFFGVGYDDDDLAVSNYTLDFWFTYKVTDALTLGGEVSYQDDASTSFLLTAQYAFTDKFSTLVRWSATTLDVPGRPWGTYLTVSPSYAFTENFIVRAEVSYADSNIVGGGGGSGLGGQGFFYGAQALFKF